MITNFTKVLLLSLCVLSLSCTASDRTRSTLEKQGFTDIYVGNHGWFDCGDSDMFATEFTAKNSQGMEVEGTVCCGMLKNCTVRF